MRRFLRNLDGAKIVRLNGEDTLPSEQSWSVRLVRTFKRCQTVRIFTSGQRIFRFHSNIKMRCTLSPDLPPFCNISDDFRRVLVLVVGKSTVTVTYCIDLRSPWWYWKLIFFPYSLLSQNLYHLFKNKKPLRLHLRFIISFMKIFPEFFPNCFRTEKKSAELYELLAIFGRTDQLSIGVTYK
jgi:hypothetical protein